MGTEAVTYVRLFDESNFGRATVFIFQPLFGVSDWSRHLFKANTVRDSPTIQAYNILERHKLAVLHKMVYYAWENVSHYNAPIYGIPIVRHVSQWGPIYCHCVPIKVV